MGLHTDEEFGLVNRSRNIDNLRLHNKNSAIEKYSNVFKGLGCFKKACVLRTKPKRTLSHTPKIEWLNLKKKHIS